MRPINNRWVAPARLMGLDLALIDCVWHVTDEDFERLRIDREHAAAQAKAERERLRLETVAKRAALKAERKQADKELQERLWGRYSELANGTDDAALEAFCAEMAREKPRYHDGAFVFAFDPCGESLRKAMVLALTLVGQGTHRDSAINIAAKRLGVDPKILSFAYFQRAGRLKHNRRIRCLPSEAAAMVKRRNARKVNPWHIDPTGPS